MKFECGPSCRCILTHCLQAEQPAEPEAAPAEAAPAEAPAAEAAGGEDGAGGE